ncbi:MULTISPECIES: hypothetical protein [unclassified Mesorhizobium]|uniref:hypothetical protein n=1 Tax=unclassified Mesorhizobium TaxID=325217 RepID=UPI000FD3DB72|nr:MULTISPECIES: hypothetical protein [unclassified Mesorhizobium]RUV28441.1 hypothetical protein EOA86_19860 [Mesorhizobium sp. M5C.F.Ca.IN.020.32.2.1]RWG45987.1 MAG: hypothetical protein EOQ62_16040 [Mesorhizobium sp.]RWH49782.1 MAG: hypothetical protein EOQ80_05995 [Mesorhizobium sp.]RWH55453.1 MAG: hypothetical protein EOQ82_16370 [Mesorhizobium sp.]RWI66157.1 MAG: hypothetical protein EOR19_32215 [Mesorhizobium sp.]
MTIDERRERERLERENPWRPIGEAMPDGMICELRMSNLTELGRHRFFLHGDARWYRIDPPQKINPYVELLVEYRPTGVTLSKHRRENAVWLAEEGGRYEYRGGELYRKPKPYKLYWRADDAKGDK